MIVLSRLFYGDLNVCQVYPYLIRTQVTIICLRTILSSYARYLIITSVNRTRINSIPFRYLIRTLRASNRCARYRRFIRQSHFKRVELERRTTKEAFLADACPVRLVATVRDLQRATTGLQYVKRTTEGWPQILSMTATGRHVLHSIRSDRATATLRRLLSFKRTFQAIKRRTAVVPIGFRFKRDRLQRVLAYKRDRLRVLYLQDTNVRRRYE